MATWACTAMPTSSEGVLRVNHAARTIHKPIAKQGGMGQAAAASRAIRALPGCTANLTSREMRARGIDNRARKQERAVRARAGHQSPAPGSGDRRGCAPPYANRSGSSWGPAAAGRPGRRPARAPRPWPPKQHQSQAEPEHAAQQQRRGPGERPDQDTHIAAPRPPRCSPPQTHTRQRSVPLVTHCRALRQAEQVLRAA